MCWRWVVVLTTWQLLLMNNLTLYNMFPLKIHWEKKTIKNALCVNVVSNEVCYNLSLADLWQLAASLWITSFDNQLATSLLQNKRVLNKPSRGIPAHPDIGLLITTLIQQGEQSHFENSESQTVRHSNHMIVARWLARLSKQWKDSGTFCWLDLDWVTWGTVRFSKRWKDNKTFYSNHCGILTRWHREQWEF